MNIFIVMIYIHIKQTDFFLWKSVNKERKWQNFARIKENDNNNLNTKLKANREEHTQTPTDSQSESWESNSILKD